ncbi:MAG: glycosyltransferase [Desulfomonile tiedjei]|nr:glycosyltransferase [Desulfomonile tiedjei]
MANAGDKLVHPVPDLQSSFGCVTPPRFTIITATYNAEQTLQRCIDGVAAQRYPFKEHIIIDGASRDNTVSVIVRNEHQIAFWLSEPDFGVYHAWNKGLKQSSGDWIAFLGADEWYVDDAVLESVAVEIKKPDRHEPAVYGCTQFVHLSGKAAWLQGEPWVKARLWLPRCTPIPTAATFFHRSLFDRYGEFNEDFRICGDYEFMLRFLPEHGARFIPGITVFSAVGGLSLSRENEVTKILEIARSKRLHGLPAYSLPLFRQVAEAYVSALLPKIVGKRRAAAIRVVLRKMCDRPPPLFEE